MLDEIVYGFDITRVVGNVFYLILVLIVLDIVTGLLVAGKERMINSSINFDGLIRKAGVIVGLSFLTLIDSYLKADGYIVKIGSGLLVTYEVISIIENFSRIGINLDFISKYFDKDKVGRE